MMVGTAKLADFTAGSGVGACVIFVDVWFGNRSSGDFKFASVNVHMKQKRRKSIHNLIDPYYLCFVEMVKYTNPGCFFHSSNLRV